MLIRVVIVASVVMSISMGLRQCLGLFLGPVGADLGVSATSFGLAVAVHNLVWGLTQPAIGALGDRFGPLPVLLGCGALYAVGLVLMATSNNPWLGLGGGIGLLAGVGVAGTGFGVLLGAVSRIAPADRRSTLLGLVSGCGSVGILVLAPLGDALITSVGWRGAAMAYAAIAASMVAIAPLIGGTPVSSVAAETTPTGPTLLQTVRAALAHRDFALLSLAFFACGFQLMFITTHLPRFLGLCGLPPSVGAYALGLIGVCNAVGSYAFGILGQRFNPKHLLALIYAIRTAAIIVYVGTPVSAFSTLVFAAVMGATWLGVVPLVSSLIGRMFGLARFNMLFGMVFLGHQAGSFAGAWTGGVILDLTGVYTIAWWSLVAVGVIAAWLQWSMKDQPAASTDVPTAASA